MSTLHVLPDATATNTTHLLWAGRWIEVRSCNVLGEHGWTFKTGRDAADWLMWPSEAAALEDGHV